MGITPTVVAISPTVSLSLRWSWLELGLEVRDVLPASGGSPSVRASLLGGGPFACLRRGPVFGCAVTLLGSFQADTPTLQGTTSANAFYFAAGLRAGAVVHLGLGVSARGSLDLLADPSGPTVRALGGQVWNAPPLSGGALLAMEVKIP